ncbi:MAG: MerR family transcriptional regulator [Pseudonocardiales bacterium]|nr:MerR family transcriptional regulator [Pseudonocardiales bacterium]
MLTIGQLARYVGVSIKTVRVYHAKGLLPEPARDASGYRRYTAADAVALIEVRTLAEAGVPLAQITRLRTATNDETSQALAEIDLQLGERLHMIEDTRRRLRRLAAGDDHILPREVEKHLAALRHLGFSQHWVAMETDLWILAYATHPDIAEALFEDQAQALEQPALLQLYLEYDQVHDLDPNDPRIDDLANRLVSATLARYGDAVPQGPPASDIPDLMQAAVNASSLAWRRLDRLIRSQLTRPT